MKKKITVAGITVLLLFLMIQGCSKTNADSVANNSCDTSTIGYQNDVLPIIKSYCYPCHGNGNTVFSNNAVNLEGYFIDSILGSSMLAAVRHDPGVIGMPFGKPKINECDINKLAAWVNQGYKK